MEGCDLNRNYGMVVILFYFLSMIIGKTQVLDEGSLFIDRFKVGSVPGMNVALVASKKLSKSFMSMMQDYQ